MKNYKRLSINDTRENEQIKAKQKAGETAGFIFILNCFIIYSYCRG